MPSRSVLTAIIGFALLAACDAEGGERSEYREKQAADADPCAQQSQCSEVFLRFGFAARAIHKAFSPGGSGTVAVWVKPWFFGGGFLRAIRSETSNPSGRALSIVVRGVFQATRFNNQDHNRKTKLLVRCTEALYHFSQVSDANGIQDSRRVVSATLEGHHSPAFRIPHIHKKKLPGVFATVSPSHAGSSVCRDGFDPATDSCFGGVISTPRYMMRFMSGERRQHQSNSYPPATGHFSPSFRPRPGADRAMFIVHLGSPDYRD